MFKQRFITATILALLFLSSLILLTPTVFVSLIFVIVLIAGWEWGDLTGLNSTSKKLFFLVALMLSMAAAAQITGIYGVFNQAISYWVIHSVVLLWGVIYLWLLGYPSSAILWSSKPIMCLLGLILLTATWVALASIIFLEKGRALLGLAIAIIVLADSGGYIAGKLFGRHKLAPTISPGKTWEGLFGGLLFQSVLVIAVSMLWPDTDLLKLCLLVVLVALSSVVGDLFESMLKRHRGLKDSSNLLPGHGGFLDRLDGVMAALPVFFVVLIKANPF